MVDKARTLKSVTRSLEGLVEECRKRYVDKNSYPDRSIGYIIDQLEELLVTIQTRHPDL